MRRVAIQVAASLPVQVIVITGVIALVRGMNVDSIYKFDSEKSR